jgi:hypothetical protein
LSWAWRPAEDTQVSGSLVGDFQPIVNTFFKLCSFATEAGQCYSYDSESDKSPGEASHQFNDIEDSKDCQEAGKMPQNQPTGSARPTARSLSSAVGEKAGGELLPPSFDNGPTAGNGSNTQIFQVLDGLQTLPPKKKKKFKAVE